MAAKKKAPTKRAEATSSPKLKNAKLNKRVFLILETLGYDVDLEEAIAPRDW